MVATRRRYGKIAGKPTQEPKHVRCIVLLHRLLNRVVSNESFILIRCAIRLTDDTEPEPDVTITREWDYTRSNPTPADILLIMEVRDSTIREDRGEKLPRYARAGIPEVWIVDVNAGVITRYSAPHDGRYVQVVSARAGETLASSVVPSLVVPVADVLP